MSTLTQIPVGLHLESWDAASFLGFDKSSLVTVLVNISDNFIPTEAGVAPTHCEKYAFHGTAVRYNSKYISDTPFGDPHSLVDTTSWKWQPCRQFGEWQTTQSLASPNTNLISRFL